MTTSKNQNILKKDFAKDCYVHDSMIALWDCIDNAGDKRNTETTTWTDCISGYKATLVPGPNQSDSLSFRVLERTIKIDGNLEITNMDDKFVEALFGPSYTVEAVISLANPQKYRQYVLCFSNMFGTTEEAIMWQNNAYDLYNDFPSSDWRININHGIDSSIGYFAVTQNNFLKTLYSKNMQSKTVKLYNEYKSSDYISIQQRCTLVGSSYAYYDFSSHGNVCSVRVHIRALTEEELAFNYNADKQRFGI